MKNFDGWNQRRVLVTPMQLLYIAWTKFKLGEMDFLEFKDRVRAIEGTKNWVTRFEVPEKALSRFRSFGVLDPEANSEFLKLHLEGKFRNIHKYGINIFLPPKEDMPEQERKTDESSVPEHL